MEIRELMLQSEINRKRLIEVIYKANAGHTGGDLSCLNLLTVLYFTIMRTNPDCPDDDSRDRFILSKGHCVEALYVTLESKGFITKEMLDTLGQYGSALAGHPAVAIPGIEVNTGALGHGLSVGVGIALAARMDGKTHRTFVLMGDGEQGEGSIYEAAMAARQYKLDNLVAIIDRNHLQISGDTEDIMAIDDIGDRWIAFGWEVKDMNGDDMDDIVRTLRAIDFTGGRPHLLVAHTTKGKGVAFMEGVAGWHHGVPGTEQYRQAINEISERIKQLESN
jgi:transketolase